MRLEISADADADLREVVAFSIEQFGIEQARRYTDALRLRMHALVDQPRGRRTERLKPSLLRVKQGSHFIFFKVEGDSVLIVRILHERRDFLRQLA